MEKLFEPIDSNGNLISEGDWVFFEQAPETLLEGLPVEDQENIKLQTKVPIQVIGFDPYGNVEMMWSNEDETRFTTIWVAPSNLFKTDKLK